MSSRQAKLQQTRRLDNDPHTTRPQHAVRKQKADLERHLDEKLETGWLLFPDKRYYTGWTVPLWLILAAFGVYFSMMGFPVPDDCDEVYNYWEPLHHLIYGGGMQTWEYSPKYALRSWFYIHVHAILAYVAELCPPFAKAFGIAVKQPKLFDYYGVRIGLLGFSLYAFIDLGRALTRHLGKTIGFSFLIMSLFSTAFYISSSAFLPSSFSMACNALVLSGVIQRSWTKCLCFTALTAVLGWPYAAFLSGVVGLEMFIHRYHTCSVDFLRIGFISTFSLLLIVFLADSFVYSLGQPPSDARWLLTCWNQIRYNVFGQSGPNLYGEEGYTFYLKNLLLNMNIVVGLAVIGCICVTLYAGMDEFYDFVRPKLINSAKKRDTWPDGKNIFLRHRTTIYSFGFAIAYLAIFTVMKHKEERFLYPVYPHIFFAAAVGLDWLARGANMLCGRKHPLTASGTHASNSWLANLIVIGTLTSFVVFSGMRTSIVFNYRASQNAFYSLGARMEDPRQMHKISKHDPVRVCMGKTWYLFPSSFFLPEKVKFHGRDRGVELRYLKSEFKGILPQPFGKGDNSKSDVPAHMNDQNREEPSRYVPLDSCDYIVDLEVMNTTQLEPNYFLKYPGKFRRLFEEDYLVREENSPWQRLIRIPEKLRVALELEWLRATMRKYVVLERVAER